MITMMIFQQFNWQWFVFFKFLVHSHSISHFSNSKQDVMQFFFIFTTIVAMVMCFFSLTSSMYTNINEQAKEIGVMRAIGASRFLLARAYVYEALILILCASFMGICIGFVMGYTMTLQVCLSFFQSYLSKNSKIILLT